MHLLRRRLPALLAALAIGVGSLISARADEGPAVPSFVDETAAAGLDSVYAGDWEYMVGGGAASFDCDDDGFPDLLLAGGEAPAKFYRNASELGGALKFEEGAASGLELDAVTGAYPLDIDGDGRMDLVLLRIGENVVMRGLGGCKFERANEAFGFDGGDGWSTALAATWEKGASWPTIAIGNYIDRSSVMPWGSCTDNWLHRPQGSGPGFAPPLALTPSYCALSMLFTDWNRSGTPALRVSNDREYYKGGQEQLWRVEPGKAPALYTEADGWRYVRIWGMGIASYDLDLDGFPEYYLTSMADNRLQKLAPVPDGAAAKPSYGDVALAKGVTAHRPYVGDDVKPSTAWHAQFEDVNNDGLVDLFVAKGNVAEMPDFAALDPNNLLLQQPDGKFVEAGDRAGVASTRIARGALLTDFNLDGRVDLVVVNRWKGAELWRNTGAGEGTGAGLLLKLAQPGPNRDAIGAFVEVRCGERVLRREITVGGGHASGHAGWWHFGLGGETEAEVRVLWPDGTAGPWHKVAAEGRFVLGRDADPMPWSPG
ncbi:CRTAC1 family protein [Methylobrevis sp. L22]|uniref:CRTAC1 family protein n=2 Tax=Methylobrevis albus TaxID=2793297 RepID=A0A931MYZ1_9HYPH|nr:CRTAC1 family protein [Methylobrevis albus]